jgi:hypothetical protein
MDIASEEPVVVDNRLTLLKKYLSVDGVVSSEKRWWTGSQGFDFKTGATENDSNDAGPSAEVINF